MLLMLMLLMLLYLVGFEPTTMAVQINGHHLALPLSYRYKYHGLIWFGRSQQGLNLRPIG